MVNTETFGDERAFVRACRDGEQAALAAFYDRYFTPVYRYVLASVGQREDAEDITAEVFVKAFGGLQRFDHQAKPLAAWLFRITRNQVVDHYRRKSRRISASSIDAQQEQDAGRFDPWETSALLMDLARALRVLPEARRQAVLLRSVAGLSTREAAEAMGIPEGTLRSHLHYGMQALRAAMEGET
jgi:RNA polymerase sigma-70 factor (ECF subfamily)